MERPPFSTRTVSVPSISFSSRATRVEELLEVEGEVGRDDRRAELPDHLLGPPAIEALGALVPAQHGAVGGEAVDRVDGRVHDRRHPRMLLPGSRPLRDVDDAGRFTDRDELVDVLASFVAVRGSRGVVVFDGSGEERDVGPLAVRFAPNADTLLERLAAERRDRRGRPPLTSDAAGTRGRAASRCESAARWSSSQSFMRSSIERTPRAGSVSGSTTRREPASKRAAPGPARGPPSRIPASTPAVARAARGEPCEPTRVPITMEFTQRGCNARTKMPYSFPLDLRVRGSTLRSPIETIETGEAHVRPHRRSTLKSPQKLQRELEDLQLVLKARNGIDAARDELMRRYQGFVRLKASSYFLAGGDAEDLIQEGMIGLYKAIRDFRHDKETSFRSFAELCVTRQIITAIKSATRYKHAPLNTYISFSHTPPGRSRRASARWATPCRAPQSTTRRSASSPPRSSMRSSAASARAYPASRSTCSRSTSTATRTSRRPRSSTADCKTIDNALQRVKRKILVHQATRAVPA